MAGHFVIAVRLSSSVKIAGHDIYLVYKPVYINSIS
jgi:hypothetical protein